ncbi:MAG TPA: cytochrome P450 [Myxococcota bacterium]|nr:cytochrome P450 [Myxococcota bacterium]
MDLARTPLAEINPFDPAVLVDPWLYYRRVRESAPVYRHPQLGITLISSYRAVSEVVRNWEAFSNRFGQFLGAEPPEEVKAVAREGYPPVDTMLTADPPEQRRFRSLVNKAFGARRVDALEPRIREIARELAEDIAARGRAELLAEFAQPLPLTVIAEQLGAPRADLRLFRRWTDGFVAQLSGVADRAGQVEAAKLIVEFQKYFAARLEERRLAPREDILSDIVHARVEGERPLDVPEMLSILQQLLVAGNETTASAIVEGLWLLLRNPEQLALLRREPERIPNLVEEVLRMATPTANMWRVCRKTTAVEGVEIPAGSLCMLRFAAANRDPAQFPEPDRFDVTRANAGEHLAFGLGIHHCIGASLARKELRVAFETLLERFEEFRPAPDAPAPAHKPNVLLWGLDRLDLVLRPRALG